MENKKKIFVSIGLILILIIFLIYYLFTKSNNEEIVENLILVENEEKETENIMINEVKKKEKVEIAVHIIGAVKKEGIIYIEEGSRIADVIKMAGGETKEADLSQINLAYIVQDGEKIYIPNKNEKISEYIINSNGDTLIEADNLNNNIGKEKKVNINTANLSELDTLPGIGPAIAQRIIDYREENGNFKSIDELQNVKGIGDAKFEEVKDSIIV